MPRRNIRKSKKTGGRKSGVPMPVVIGVGLLALAAALLLVMRVDLGRQLMTAVPSGSPTPTPGGIVWGCTPPAQNGCKCTYNIPVASTPPTKTVYLPAQFKLCSSKLGGSRLSSDATSVEGKVCVEECSDYIKALGYNEVSPGRPAGSVYTSMCYKVGGSSPVPCREGARWGDPEPFTWDQCKIQCRCLYKKGTSTQTLSVPNTPASLEGDFCAASGHPPASMLEKFVGDCPSSCQDATPADWQYVRLAEPEYAGTCKQNEQCDLIPVKVGFHYIVSSTKEGKRLTFNVDVYADPDTPPGYLDLNEEINGGYRIKAPYDIKFEVTTGTGLENYTAEEPDDKNLTFEKATVWTGSDGRYTTLELGYEAATPGEDYAATTNIYSPTIYKGQRGGSGYTYTLDDKQVEEIEEYWLKLKAYSPQGHPVGIYGSGTMLIIIEDDDGPAASGSPAPSLD
ncbi:MAG: hypothetical protein ABIH36_01225 [bacterium]